MRSTKSDDPFLIVNCGKVHSYVEKRRISKPKDSAAPQTISVKSNVRKSESYSMSSVVQ